MIIVVNFERGGGVWKGLEHSNQNSHSWNTCTQCYFHTSIVFYGSALTLSLSGKGLILRERWAHHLKLTLCRTSQPLLERATRHEPSPLSCVCFYRLILISVGKFSARSFRCWAWTKQRYLPINISHICFSVTSQWKNENRNKKTCVRLSSSNNIYVLALH